jgi:hypothetical protein
MSPRLLGLGCLALCLGWPLFASADTKHVESLRVQKVGDTTYFHVRIQTPPNLLPEAEQFNRLGWFQVDQPILWPRLIESDGKLSVVCPRVSTNNRGNRFDRVAEKIEEPNPSKKDEKTPAREPREPERVQGLEFVGRVTGAGKVEAKLLFPVAGKRLPLVGRFSRTPPAPQWKELVVTLDFDQAKEVPIPADAKARSEAKSAEQWSQYPPLRDDLEGLWAVAQIEQFDDLDSGVNEFGFYQFASLAMSRKYHVAGQRGPVFRGGVRDWRIADRGDEVHQLFELTTGAAAITESLQLRRMNDPRGNPDQQKRNVPIAKVRGIDIAEHPWKEMIGDNKPAAEPMAKLVPHDHYFIHFKKFASFVEVSDLMDQWGTSLNRAYQANSRDYRIKERYEQQLCLKSTALGRTLGPLVIEGVAITGSDPMLREGSDVSLLFQVKNSSLFLAAVDPFLAEAKKKFADVTEDSFTQGNVKVEGYRTRYREVSVYRATIGNVVAYSNSPAAMRRIIDTQSGKRKALADSLDYQYMRTVFSHADADESGFVFLSDAFIRTLVGPATRIKEKRRLEALASMHMLTHGAMFAGWESGKEAESLESVLALSTLKPQEVPMPEGKPATWDAARHMPHSEIYNTPHFATPLIELPIDEVTEQEQAQYERFRLEYMGLWREFFDPIGVRIALKDGNVQVDTYILPLIQNSAYNRLRQMTGSGTTKYAPKAIPANTLAQYLQHINPQTLFGAAGIGRGGDNFLLEGVVALLNPIGEWYFVRMDDSTAIPKIVAALDKLNQGEGFSEEDIVREAWQLPIVVGADIRNPVTLAAALTTLRVNVMKTLPGGVEWEPLKEEYKGVSIVRVGATKRGREQLMGGGGGRRDPFLPAIYYAMTDGAFYVTLNEPTMRGMIDSLQSQKEGKLPTVQVNTSLYLSPQSAVATRPLLEKYLEVQSHQQAMKSLPIWDALYRSRVVAMDAKQKEAEEAAFRFLGFVPVSPESAAFRFDAATQEVVNERHGSLRQPKHSPALAENSPLQILLRQIGTMRADLRFREDGIHTVLTIERQAKP